MWLYMAASFLFDRYFVTVAIVALIILFIIQTGLITYDVTSTASLQN